MHDTEGMLKTAVLSRGIDPARTLELMYPAEPLHPGIINDVLLRYLGEFTVLRNRERYVVINGVCNQGNALVGSGELLSALHDR
jgi:hypothetical protein